MTSRAPLAARALACLRLQEIVVLQGAPLLGFAFALGPSSPIPLGRLALLAAGSVCLVAHTFLLNDWANLDEDLADPHKAPRVFTARGVSRAEVGRLVLFLLAASLVLLAALGPLPLGLGAAIAALGALYSLPSFNWKARPLLSSAAHLAGGTLHFLLGYSLAGGALGRGLTIGAFFGLTFAAGHLNQEVRDHDGDARSGIRTHAVVFGRRPTFLASLALFTLAHALLFVLALRGTIPRPLVALVVLCPLQLQGSREPLAEGLSYESVVRLQARYRAVYAIIGLALVAALGVERLGS